MERGDGERDRLRVCVVDEEETIVRQRSIKFMMREAVWLYMFLKGTNTFVGMIALHHIEWKIPKFEIGYWVHTKFERQGYAREAVEGITRFAFDYSARVAWRFAPIS